MKFSRIWLIFSIGFFAILSQVLLFREFLVAFEGNELGIGAFFASWFLWIIIGAGLIYHSERLAEALLRHFELVALLYLPAFVIQFGLIIEARDLAGVDPYELFSWGPMIGVAFLVNGPVSFMTGILFPLGCRWVSRAGHLPVARVYVIESAGSFVGGIAATVMLAGGADWPVMLGASGALLSVSAALAGVGRRRWLPLALGVGLVCLLVLPTGLNEACRLQVAQTKWNRLLGKAEFGGSFQTPQAEYLYGSHQGQFLVASAGQVCLSLPNREAAGEIAALHLAQNPRAERVLIAGSDTLAVAREFLSLGQITEIALYDPDPRYFGRLAEVLPDEYALTDERVRLIETDIRARLAAREDYFDVVILNFPDPTTAVLNRYFTVEFYRAVHGALKTDGVLGVRVSGGENVMGSELAALGTSAWRTLQEVFGQMAIKPGEETWLLASDGADLDERPGALAERYGQIPGAAEVFPPAGMFSLFPLDRVELARRTYDEMHLPRDFAINRDAKPLAHLYSLLLLAKHVDSPWAGVVKMIGRAGLSFFMWPMVVMVVLRGVYVLGPWRGKRAEATEDSQFTSVFLVFSGGLVCMGADIVMMYRYQTAYGSLHLHIGLISSLLMLGLLAGAAGMRHLVQLPRLSWRSLAMVAAALQTILLIVAASWSGQWDYGGFAVGFVLCGLLTGMYFPLAARALEGARRDSRRAGASLELADHLGAAVGGFLVGLIMLPVLGSRATLGVLAAVPAMNIVLLLLGDGQRSGGGERRTAERIRALGYVCLGVTVCVVMGAQMLRKAGADLTPGFTRQQAGLVAPNETLVEREAQVEDTGEAFTYFAVEGSDDYVFRSGPLVGDVRGFGGEIDFLIRLSGQGKLVDFMTLDSSETPAYLGMLEKWNESLLGWNVFGPKGSEEIPAVTGATVSANATLATLLKAGQRFAEAALGAELAEEVQSGPTGGTLESLVSVIYLAATGLVALLLAGSGGKWWRRGWLVICVGVGGYWLNTQYASEQVISLLTGRLGTVVNIGLWLTLGIVVLVAVFGNVYCGYMCPFGALQELIGHLMPGRWRLRPGRDPMRWARFGKYLVLAMLICAYFVTREREVLGADVQIMFFSKFPLRGIWFILAPLGGLVLLLPRFWCRCLCPAGAWLALVSAYAPLKRLFPKKVFSRCDLGVTSAAELDCICCDRCRYEVATKVERHRGHGWVAGVAVVVMILLMMAVSLAGMGQDGAAPGGEGMALPGSAGEARDIDAAEMRELIDTGTLSDHEARYYRKVEGP